MQYIEAQEATLEEVPQHIRDHYNRMFKELKAERDNVQLALQKANLHRAAQQLKAQAQTNKETK